LQRGLVKVFSSPGIDVSGEGRLREMKANHSHLPGKPILFIKKQGTIFIYTICAICGFNDSFF